MSKLKFITGLLALCVTAPIFVFLIYSLMVATNQDRLAWFLFWVYVPFRFLVGILKALADSLEEK